MEGGTLKAEPLIANAKFNWTFLVELIVCGILVIFFLFYFNRVFATLVSYGLRAFTWHYYKVYVDVHALQISPLGGRIFFKGFRYHGQNETILIQQGYVTWQYWLTSVQRSEYVCPSSSKYRPRSDDDIEHDFRKRKRSAKKLPCRFELTVNGVEWFIYNRTAAYDSILEGFGHKPAKNVDGQSGSGEANASRSSALGSTGFEKEARNDASRGSSGNNPSFLRRCSTSIKSNLPFHGLVSRWRTGPTSQSPGSTSSLFERTTTTRTEKPAPPRNDGFLKLLPINITCVKGAIVMGNENTQTILSTSFDSAQGQFDASNAGPYDLYKLIVDLEFTHPVVQIRPNPDFKHYQIAIANQMRMSADFRRKEDKKRHSWWPKRKARKAYHALRDMVPYFRQSVESFHFGQDDDERTPNANKLPGETRWQGLGRYREDVMQDVHEGWNYVEYGRCSVLVDSPLMSMSYYWDVAGKVPPPTSVDAAHSWRSQAFADDINGSEPPEWGLHLSFSGGHINYGPWADRQRAGLQNVFFPNFYRNNYAAPPLMPGEDRQATFFKLTIDFEKETVLRIPTREPSKDWLWKDRIEAARFAAKKKKDRDKKHPRDKEVDKGGQGPDVRPYGWLSLFIDGDSSMCMSLDMVPSSTGFKSKLSLDLHSSRLITSVNHGLLWQSGRQTVECDLSVPLEWNGLRTWTFNIESHGLDLYLLRDHTYLISDIVSDWTSGPSPDYYTFVPFNYHINLSFDAFRLLLNVNDQNIINNPTDLTENAFLIINCQRFETHVCIPSTKFQASRNTIPFELNLRQGSIDLSTPTWNTYHSFLPNKCVATLADLKVEGGYTYHSITLPSLTETLTLDISGASPKLYLYGFLLRYFLQIKANYFGDHVHFKTLEEFQRDLRHPEQANQPTTNPARKSNDLDVIVQIRGEDPCILIPANIYVNKKCLRLDSPSFETELRFTNYYMDFQTTVSPLQLTIETIQRTRETTKLSPQLFIDGVNIYAHRLFGPPPHEETYVCNWDFGVGDVAGECSPEFLQSAASAFSFLGFTISDGENAVPTRTTTVYHDVTFLRAKVESIRLWVLVDDAALLLSSGDLNLNHNDWAGTKFSSRTNLHIPDLVFSAVSQKTMHCQGHSPLDGTKERPDEQARTALTYAYFETGVNLKILKRDFNLVEERELQQRHIRLCDYRTGRAACLLHDPDAQDEALQKFLRSKRLDPPAMVSPAMPEPLQTAFYASPDHLSEASFDTTSQVQSVGHNSGSSFLSQNSSEAHPTPQYFQARSPGRARRGSSFRSASIGNIGSARPGDHRSRHEGNPFNQPSPWAMPHFHFFDVQPDTTEVPLLKDQPQLPQSRFAISSDGIEDDYKNDQEAVNRVHILCGLPGLRGFCSPKMLLAMASFTDKFSPSSPLDILDHLHRTAISDVIDYEKFISQPKTKSLLDLSVQLPASHIRIVNASDPSSSTQMHDLYRDQYDLKLSYARVLFRQRSERREERATSVMSGYAVHATADSLSLSAQSEKLDVMEERGIFHLKLQDILILLASTPKLCLKLQLQNFDTVTSSKAVGDVAALIERTSKLADTAILPFQRITAMQIGRLRYVVYNLSVRCGDGPGPSFLTRPSYVLRATGQHLRQHDSWKILVRLRYVYNNLPEANKRQFLDEFWEKLPSFHDAADRVFANFDRWRSWDLSHVRKSHLMQLVFGNARAVSIDEAQKPVDADCSVFLGNVRFRLDPGPRETFLFFENLGASIRVETSRAVANLPIEAQPRTVLIQAYCTDANLTIRWEVCELISDILANIEKFIPQAANPPQVSQDDVQQGANHDINLHLVFMADKASVVLDAINVVVLLTGDGLKGSLIEQTPGSHLWNNLSVIVDCDEASVEFKERQNRLMIWRLQYVKLFVSHLWTILDAGRRVHDWKATAASESLRYDLEEDPSGMLHVLNRLLDDEVRWVVGLMNVLEEQSRKRRPHAVTSGPEQSANESTPPDVHRLHSVIFLGEYEICLALLPSLSYVISGEVARLSIAPGLNPKKLEIDWDVKHNYHRFQSAKGSYDDVIASVNIPPINGRVVLDMHAPTRTEVDVDTTIELISIDAGSVQNLLHTVRAPEISHLVSNLKSDFSVVHHKLRTVMPDEMSPQLRPADEQSEFAYRIRLTMAGFDIRSIAPGVRNKSYVADMTFSFGMIQAHLENAAVGGPILEHPEFNLELFQLSFELVKRSRDKAQSCGALTVDLQVLGTSRRNDKGLLVRTYHLASKGLQLELLSETASMAVDIAAHLQERLKTLDLTSEIKHLRRLKFIPSPNDSQLQTPIIETTDYDEEVSKNIFDSIISVDLNNIQVAWVVSKATNLRYGRRPEDLVFSIRKVNLATKKEDAARLRIEHVILQMVPARQGYRKRSRNSLLLPEVVFNAAYCSSPNKQYRLIFEAAGKAVNVKMASDMIFAASVLQQSVATAKEKLTEASAFWKAHASTEKHVVAKTPAKKEKCKFASLRIVAEFAGAVFNLQGRKEKEGPSAISPFSMGKSSWGDPTESRYGSYTERDKEDLDAEGPGDCSATFRFPGLHLKAQYECPHKEDPTINAEIQVLSSSNTFYPPLVFLINQMSSSIQEVVKESNHRRESRPVGDKGKPKHLMPSKEEAGPSENKPQTAQSEAATILGRCKVNVGLRIRRQEFTLSCQPIARVVASAAFEGSYLTLSTVTGEDESHQFFALVVTFDKAEISVKHVYSNDSTASLAVDHTIMSLMNSRHVSSNSGVSAILKLSPVKAAVDIRQVQDFLLFGEIWFPPTKNPPVPQQQQTYPGSKGSSSEEPKKPPPKKASPRHSPSVGSSPGQMVAKYQQVTSQGSFRWNSIVAIERVDIVLDMGQTVGRSSFIAWDLWLSSRKSSDCEQHLCLGLSSLNFVNKGRLDAEFVLSRFRVHSAIEWPKGQVGKLTPLVQATATIGKLCGTAAFEYQEFLIADISDFHFAMHNVRNDDGSSLKDRLVATLEGDRAHVFMTALTPAMCVSLYQTIQRLIKGKKAAYEASIKEIQRFIRKKSERLPVQGSRQTPSDAGSAGAEGDHDQRMPISLHTDVMVNLHVLHVGVFPNTFEDRQVFKVEGLDFVARFGVSPLEQKIHSGLRLELGQLRVALSEIALPALEEPEDMNVTVKNISDRSIQARGGIILKVPKVIASMLTWQAPGSNLIEYIYKSTFKGKVDVGWNYSRISFIRNMWAAHSRALASRLGKPLPQSAVQITSEKLPDEEHSERSRVKATAQEIADLVGAGESDEPDEKPGQSKEKITAVVNVPVSKYEYKALEPPVIDTPQLREMGEATPPLEWIGLNREKLPNVTHQVLMVPLTGVATDVEDAYSRILGSNS